MAGSIDVRRIGKRYRRYHPNRPQTLQEAVLRGLRGLQPLDRFWALRDVTFHVSAGSMVGLIGANGAGKSTLLRLIGGVGRPDAGWVKVRGRIGALLDLGAGMHPELTGRENVYINGVISGLTRRELSERFDEIVAFAELEAFIDSPLRTYSSGMQMRLAFAVASHIDPDVLLIDEALAVGDLAFQHKCLQRISNFIREGCAAVLVSHDLEFVARLCDEVIWLDKGEMVARGAPDLVIGHYVSGVERERAP